MPSPFTILSLLALAALVVAAWMIVRARKPLQLPALNLLRPQPPKSPEDLIAAERNWGAAALSALRYLSARREWRYQVPWMLMLGEAKAGKTSIVASVKSGRRQKKLLREQWLSVKGTDWHFFNEGVVIDPSGAYSAAAADSAEGKRWRSILDQLDNHRPERALDGLVLVVSAATLLQGTADARREAADLCFRQLWELQKRFEFAFPVFIVVSQCDTVEGFTAFWKAQPDPRRDEIFGWSSRYLLAEGSAGEWANSAFESLALDVRALQVQAAAGSGEIEDVDQFFLFPQRFQQLKVPLQAFLEAVFEASAYHANFYFMGLYFAGSIEAAGDIFDRPRSDVNFVDDLFAKKIFAETELARPTRKGILSRNRLIRRIQVAGVSVMACLCVALAVSGHDVSTQVDALTASMRTIRKGNSALEQYRGCVSRSEVYPLLIRIAQVDLDASYWAIPVSWLDNRVISTSVRLISEAAYKQIVFPSLACQLGDRGELIRRQRATLPSGDVGSEKRIAQITQALTDHVRQVKEFEQNLKLFNDVKRTTSEESGPELMREFSALAGYVYEAPLPKEVLHGRGANRYALATTSYEGEPSLPARWHADVAHEIRSRAANLAKRTIQEAGLGAKLLGDLDRSDESAPKYPLRSEQMLKIARQFDLWVAWARKDWLHSTEENNPCQRVAEALRGSLDELKGKRFERLDEALSDLAGPMCYQQVVQQFRQMRFAPYGPVFLAGPNGLDFVPALAGEVRGLEALSGLGFMQGTVAEPFQCRSSASGWQAQSLAQAARFIREYQAFARAHGAQPENDDSAVPAGYPLYNRLARGHLNHVLDGLMNDAQAKGEESGIVRTGLGLASTPDETLARQSADFARVLDSLVQVLRMYKQLGFDASHTRIAQCARDFAANALLRIDAMAESSRLYDPSTVAGANGSMQAAFFDLGSTAVTKDYLAQQLQRSGVLAGYAAPFVEFLRNTDSINESQRANNRRTPYWDNTITELNRFVQFKEPNGQVAYLDDLFMKQLADLNPDNCTKVMADYRPSPYGNDLFSERRRVLEAQARWRCTDRKQADAYLQYRSIAMRFNRELAGRYPFSDASAPDAPLATVKAFFADYANERDALRQSLAALNGERWRSVKRFVEQLDRAAGFFGSSLSAGDTSLPLHLDVRFRALPGQSPGSEQVVEWLLTIGENTARYPNGKTALDWPFGQPVLLELAWARQSKFRPIGDAAQPDLQVTDTTASFVATGPWALLRLLDAHRPRGGPAFDPLDPSSAMLEFVVPVANGSTKAKPSSARMYLGLSLSGQDPKTRARTPVAASTAFPRSAPTLW